MAARTLKEDKFFQRRELELFCVARHYIEPRNFYNSKLNTFCRPQLDELCGFDILTKSKKELPNIAVEWHVFRKPNPKNVDIKPNPFFDLLDEKPKGSFEIIFFFVLEETSGEKRIRYPIFSGYFYRSRYLIDFQILLKRNVDEKTMQKHLSKHFYSFTRETEPSEEPLCNIGSIVYLPRKDTLTQRDLYIHNSVEKGYVCVPMTLLVSSFKDFSLPKKEICMPWPIFLKQKKIHNKEDFEFLLFKTKKVTIPERRRDGMLNHILKVIQK
jgi:hypothetical protein